MWSLLAQYALALKVLHKSGLCLTFLRPDLVYMNESSIKIRFPLYHISSKYRIFFNLLVPFGLLAFNQGIMEAITDENELFVLLPCILFIVPGM